MDNPIAPPGGFQQGAWYEGKQYWNGTFSKPGQINPLSNQPGAGQMVSPEVVAQTNPNNVAYIANQNKPNGSNAPSGSGIPSGGGGVGAGFSGFATPSINLPELYNSLYKDSGIESLQADLSSKEKSYNDAVSKINDNPFLSEANRVGRVQKLSTDYQNSIASLKNDVATKTADIEMQMNLQSKQFDINSEQAKTAFNQFNSLLEMGALDGASGDEIAAITRTTGLSSTLIYSAINANKAKNVKTETIKWDDGTDQGFAIVNSDTGEIISKQTVAQSDTKGGLTNTQSRGILASAASILNEVDSQYRVDKSGKAVKLQYEEDYGGDTKLSLEEYKLAIKKLIEQTGITSEQADEYLTNQMNQLGYSKWKW